MNQVVKIQLFSTYFWLYSTFYGSVTVPLRAASAVIRREKRTCSYGPPVFFSERGEGGDDFIDDFCVYLMFKKNIIIYKHTEKHVIFYES